MRDMTTVTISLVLLGIIVMGTFASRVCAGTSELWGVDGELGSPTSRLPDYSYAGYHAGEKPIPNIAVVKNVKTDFGAKGDGSSDDTQAFKNAIAGTNNGALLIPAGTYKISDRLVVDKSNIVLRGQGMDKTTIHFTKDLKDITGSNSPWKYGQGGMLWVGALTETAVGGDITRVTETASRGSKTIKVANGSGLAAGMFVALHFQSSALDRHLHNDITNGGNCDWQPHELNWVVRIDDVSGNTVTLHQPLRFDLQSGWLPPVRSYNPVKEVGVENVHITFDYTNYPGHLKEDGHNPLYFHGALNCWFRNLKSTNADNGPCLGRATKHVTCVGYYQDGRKGHHGFSFDVDAFDCLLQDFDYEEAWIHCITVNHHACGNVIRNGQGRDLCFDHHRDAPFENLFSNVHIGSGTRMYTSSGAGCAGPHSAARETFWNVKSSGWSAAPTPSWGYIHCNVIGANTTNKTEDREWYEQVTNIQPPELYEAQLQRRLGNQVDRVDMPAISPDGGIITEPTQVSITCGTSGATIHYTTDGTTPSVSSPSYSTPITINQTATLKAVGIKDGLANSYIAQAAFTFKVLPEGIHAVQAVTASKDDGNVPENTIDDDLNTRWSADGTDEWIMFDLGSEKTVGSVWIAWYQGASRISDFGISISTDGSSWTSVYDGRSSGTTTELEQHSFSPVTARYVRIDCHGNSVNNWNSITEVQISEKSGTVVSYNQRRIHRTPDLNRPTHAVSYTLLGKRLTAGKVRGMHGVIVQSSGGVTRKVLRQRESVR